MKQSPEGQGQTYPASIQGSSKSSEKEIEAERALRGLLSDNLLKNSMILPGGDRENLQARMAIAKQISFEPGAVSVEAACNASLAAGINYFFKAMAFVNLETAFHSGTCLKLNICHYN